MNFERPVFCIALALTLSVSAGCSLGPIGNRSGQGAKPAPGEISALEARIVELQRRAAIADVEIARLQRRLAEIEKSAGGEAVAGRFQAASPTEREQAPSGSEASSSGLRLQTPGVEVSDLPIEGQTVNPPTAPAEKGAAADPDAALTASAQALYDRGYTLFHRGRYVDSETAFQQFLNRYEATVLGDNAQFWIAEARYARGDIAGARAAYLETASRFPRGNKAPDALLKAGDCSLELGDSETARQSFSSVVEEFPASAAAGAARERLGLLP